MSAAAVGSERIVTTEKHSYIVGQTLGTGLQGTVKKGTCRETGEQVALKFIPKERLGVPAGSSAHPDVVSGRIGRDLANLHREVAALQKVSSHKNVVAIKDVAWDCELPRKSGAGSKNMVMIVMELAQGGEVFDYLMFTGAFNESIARAFFQQLMSALDHCHREKVCHRDLKPENLLLDSDFNLKVADFGLSAMSEEGVPLHTECGTPGYMAPEIIRRAGYRGEAADVWSSGVLLFIMLGGFPPFHMAKPGDWWFDRIRAKQHHLFWQAHCRNATFSPAAMAMLNRIFVSDPSERATVAEILADPWMTGAAAVSSEVLAADMTRRKEEVALRKRQEREEAQKKKELARMAHASAGVDPFARKVCRTGTAKTGSEPSLPPVCPSLMRDTWFPTAHDSSSVMEFLTKALKDMSAESITSSEGSFKIKAQVPSASGPVSVAVRVYREEAPKSEVEGSSMAGDDDNLIIDVRRQGGSALEFQSVYAKLEAAAGAPVTPLVVPTLQSVPSSFDGEGLPPAAGGGSSGDAAAATPSGGSVSNSVTLL